MYGISGKRLKEYAEATQEHAYEFFGAHPIHWLGQQGVRFLVYAPHAREVSVAGDANDWNSYSHPLERLEGGFFCGFFTEFQEGQRYKYVLVTQKGERLWKADPYAFYSEQPPGNASIIYDLEGYPWNDHDFLEKRAQADFHNEAMSIYEVNFASWRKWDGGYYRFEQLVDQLIPYLVDMGFTHVEIMPVTEYPYDGSWGYQQTGYYSISSRFGDPKAFMYFVDKAHQAGLGVILDWVPCHYPKDAHGLAYFDGEALYESDFWHDAYNPQWDTMNFDYGRRHVRNFFLSNLQFLAKYFHVDGLRVDAVAYMIHKQFGGYDKEDIYNDAAIEFIREVNESRKQLHGFMMIAEESSSFYGVSKSVEEGGLGFDFKWNMGWMNDTLKYMTKTPEERYDFHDKLTFPMVYAFSERFILPLSHDEVVHMKGSLVNKMPGVYHEKFAQLRLLYLYQFTHPGKKLIFMGGEFAQFSEWNEWEDLDWNLLDYPSHMNMLLFVRELNAFYRSRPALYREENSWECYDWIEADNRQQRLISFKRKNKEDVLYVLLNFSQVDLRDHPLPTEAEGLRVLIHTDFEKYGGGTSEHENYFAASEGVARVNLAARSGMILNEEDL